jgi:hypothetical protein
MARLCYEGRTVLFHPGGPIRSNYISPCVFNGLTGDKKGEFRNLSILQRRSQDGQYSVGGLSRT